MSLSASGSASRCWFVWACWSVWACGSASGCWSAWGVSVRVLLGCPRGERRVGRQRCVGWSCACWSVCRCWSVWRCWVGVLVGVGVPVSVAVAVGVAVGVGVGVDGSARAAVPETNQTVAVGISGVDAVCVARARHPRDRRGRRAAIRQGDAIASRRRLDGAGDLSGSQARLHARLGVEVGFPATGRVGVVLPHRDFALQAQLRCGLRVDEMPGTAGVRAVRLPCAAVKAGAGARRVDSARTAVIWLKSFTTSGAVPVRQVLVRAAGHAIGESSMPVSSASAI